MTEYKPPQFFMWSYLFFALPLVVFISMTQPVFYSPDETSHFIRAYQITAGDLFFVKSEKVTGSGTYTVGSMIDANILKLHDQVMKLYTDRSARLDPVRVEQLNSFKWGELVWSSTKNVAIYPPFLYVPQAIGVALGRWVDLSIMQTVRLSRLLNGVFATVIGAVALMIACRGKSILFLFLLLPMTLAQFASAGQDALCMALSAVAAAICSRLYNETKPHANYYILLLGVCLFLISTARPPYAALSLVFCVLAVSQWQVKKKRNQYLIAFIGTFSAVVVWSLYITLFVSVGFGPEGVSYKEQIVGVLNAPFGWLAILFHTWLERFDFYLQSFVGNFGYLDTPLPSFYYLFARVMMLSIFIWPWMVVDYKQITKKATVSYVLNSFVILSAMVSVYLVLYVSWTPLNAQFIDGVQGRYLIPIAFFMSLLSSDHLTKRAHTSPCFSDGILKLMLIAYACINCMVIPWTIAIRYY